MSVSKAIGPVVSAASAGPAAPDIRDIRGPIVIPSVWPTVLVVAAVVAAVALALAVVAVVVRRLRQRHVKSPAELALERLAAARAGVSDGRAAELGELISDTVRAYVEARFELRAPKLATEEFLRDLASERESPVARHRDDLAAFLGACDLAKFARFAIDREHQLAMLDAAVSFVRATDSTPVARAEGAPSVMGSLPEEART